jgi:hypothetical protein
MEIVRCDSPRARAHSLSSPTRIDPTPHDPDPRSRAAAEPELYIVALFADTSSVYRRECRDVDGFC